MIQARESLRPLTNAFIHQAISWLQSVCKNAVSTTVDVKMYYSVAMKPVIPMNMIQSRVEILTHVATTHSDRMIARETHHCRDLIRLVHHGLNQQYFYSQIYLMEVF
jgi:hypothetical protein